MQVSDLIKAARRAEQTYSHNDDDHYEAIHELRAVLAALAAAEPGPVAVEPFVYVSEHDARELAMPASAYRDGIRVYRVPEYDGKKLVPLFGEPAIRAALHPAPVPADAGAVEADIETLAWNCREWPEWLEKLVDKTIEVDERLDMSMEQAIAYAILIGRTAQPAGEGEDELLDKIDGLQADLENAVATAFHRGATEWTRLNYPDQYAKLSALSPSDKEPRS